MRFWDASSIVPLVVGQPQSDAVQAELERDPEVVVWWATRIECVSALARLDRERIREPRELAVAFDRLEALALAWREVASTDRVRQLAERILRVHPLRTGDALQLGAAIVAADGDPATVPFVTFDDRLASAARREGFPVLPV